MRPVFSCEPLTIVAMVFDVRCLGKKIRGEVEAFGRVVLPSRIPLAISAPSLVEISRILRTLDDGRNFKF